MIVQALNKQFLHEQEIRRDLYYSAPYAPFCSDNKTAGFQLPRRDAFKRQYVQLNPPCNYKVFVIDIDHEDESLWNNEEVPTPNVIIRNKNNRKVHLLFRIDDVLIKTVKNDVIVKDSPIQYAKAVYYGLCKKLGADRAAFNNVVSKNPFHPAFNTEFIHSQVYKLKDLAEFATPDWSVYRRGEKENPNPESRNLSLFHKVRFVAYGQVQRYRLANDMEGFYRAVLTECELENKFRGKGFKENVDLPSSQVKAIAKSIATFTWNKYKGSKVNRGVMSLPHDMDQKEKQKKAALYVAKKKKDRTINEVLKALEEVYLSGEKPTQERVANSCIHSLSTVKRYWSEVKDQYEGRGDCINKKVSLAVHKVSFPRNSISVKPDVSYKYNLSVFRLNRFKAELGNIFNSSDIYKLFVSNYRLDTNSGRLIEFGSDLNIQTLKKDIRTELFRGWYEIDLTFSHGQLLGTLVCNSSAFLQSKIKSITDVNGKPYGCFIEPIETYMHFISNMSEYFNSWSSRSGIDVKTIKKGLVALMNGAGEARLNKIYDGKLNKLLSDIAFFEVLTCVRLAYENIPSLSSKLRMLEVEVFKPYWGKGLIIHDSILVQTNEIATEISKQVNYLHTLRKL